MDKSGQRESQELINESFIIKSKRIWWRELVIGAFTLLVWFYCLTVIYFFLDALFSLNHKYPSIFRIVFKMTSRDVKVFLALGGVVFIVVFLLLYFWNFYNKKRYGSKTRRKYPKPTSEEDLENLNMIDQTSYRKLQNNTVIIFETNPIIVKGDKDENFK